MSIASKINAEVAAKKKHNSSPERKRKKGSTLSNISKASSDSGVGSDNELSQSFNKDIRGKILKVFDEEENDYIQDGDKVKYVGSNFDSVDNSFIRKTQKKKKKKSVQTNTDDTETETDSDEDEEDQRKLAKRSQEFRTKMTEFLSKEGKFRTLDSRTPDEEESQSRHSIEFFDDEEDRSRRSFERGNLSNRSSLRHLEHSFISPRQRWNKDFHS